MVGFGSSSDDFSCVAARGQAGERVVVIGDVHGRLDLLDRLFEEIASLNDAQPKPTTLVFLGDYIDRGDDSRKVLETLVEVSQQAGDRARFLLGNHEFMLMEFLDGTTDGQLWMANGGQQTLASFGLPAINPHASPAEIDQLRDNLRQAMGDSLHFLNALELSWTWGDFFFCHAGIDPALPLNRQESQTLIWGNPQFRDHVRSDAVCVVHGHYAEPQIQIHRSRICVDTGACYYGRLSALAIEDDAFTVLCGK